MAKKLIVIAGATGNQGSAIARGLIKTGDWHIRAVTRNPNGEKAKKLAAEGMEIVQGDYNDEESMKKAFDGAQAIFAVTNWWDGLFRGASLNEAGDIEYAQGTMLARLASQVKTLEHYIWSTLPNGEKLTEGRIPVPHFDYKARVDDYIKETLPELAAKTTFLMFGFYPTNFADFPMLKPVPVKTAPGKYLWMIPAAPSTLYPMAGDMSKEPGIWARQILANPKVSHGKYAAVCTEVLSLGEVLETWSAVSGKQGIYVEVKEHVIADLYGLPGEEALTGVRFGIEVPDWWALAKKQGLFITMEDLSISRDEVSNLRQSLEAIKEFLG
ncbi:hypothetical protein COCCADRAFT_37630 [Bipolaris zeicola 26-R-13]|uniref:NmrA-like domain-containing protein n=1 Tax=Cochliobolus carbonum (strain 26-R-13) TaxID=930089 RepID=W6Y3D6_COCC2|nr:uncharacterized protein COCCADRAFT_37630 [Bipolaris zeicola 26-R-13]EUC32458.1 hypothetical protein COCCADRAFT_37630 [Bipolaris zeicola 26-R-13]